MLASTIFSDGEKDFQLNRLIIMPLSIIHSIVLTSACVNYERFDKAPPPKIRREFVTSTNNLKLLVMRFFLGIENTSN